MKSLQNKLNLIKEGKGNKELFLKEARAMFPNVVTNALTFDQAVHNLNERGIISEGFIGLSSKRPTNPDWFSIFNENVKADNKKVEKSVEELETKGYDYKDDKNPNNLSMESMLSGYYAEMLDPKNAKKTEEEIKEIVVKNLEKDPLYYMKDGAFGIKGIGYTDQAPGLKAFDTDKMMPVKLNEAKNKAMEKMVKEVEGKSELAKAEAKVKHINELISELESKLSVTEGEDVAEMVDKKKVKEIQNNIKFLEAKKKRYEKEKARMEAKYGDKEKKKLMDEELETPNEEDGDQVEKMSYAEAVKEMLKTRGLKK